MTPEITRLLDGVADSFNPLLALLALAAPLLRWPRSIRSALTYYLCTGATVACVYVVLALDVRYQIWASAGHDYSTHSAFAAALVTSLALFNRKWLVPLVAAFLAYLLLVLIMRYHGILDVLSSSLLAAGAAVAIHYPAASRAQDPVDRPRPVA